MANFESDPRFGIVVEEVSAAPWVDAPLGVDRQPFVTCQQIGGALVLIDSTPTHIMNRVFCLGLERPATGQTIDQIVETYRQNGAENFLIHLSPMARPTTLPRLLEERGIRVVGREAVAVREVTRVRRPDPFFAVRKADESDHEAIVDILSGIGGLPGAFIDFICRSVGQPNWHHFVAVESGKPYALNGIYVKGKGAWMAPGWTLPAFRNRGAHGALIAQGINTAAEMGCEWITVSYPATVQDRTRSYERAGFKLLYMRSLFRPETSSLMPMGVAPGESQPGQ